MFLQLFIFSLKIYLFFNNLYKSDFRILKSIQISTNITINLLLKSIYIFVIIIFVLSRFSCIIEMGSKLSSTSLSPLTYSTLLKKYDIISKDQQKSLIIVKQKQSSNHFIIKENVFIQRSTYQKHLCRFNHFQEMQQSENILNLKKVWTQELNTFCSNTYKIFPMYQYSTVTLRDQLQARISQNKCFEEQQIMGIIQSCLNSLNSQSLILFSIDQIFIASDGLLKTNNYDLYDQGKLETYQEGVYYSPEKIECFDNLTLGSNNGNLLKQSVFSLGLTILNCVVLHDMALELYDPFNANKSKRFNYSLLEICFEKIEQQSTGHFSKQLLTLIKLMLTKDPFQRPSLKSIQDQLDQIVKLRQCQVQNQEQTSEQYLEQQTIKNKQNMFSKQNQKKLQLFRVQNISTIYDKKFPSTFRNKDCTQNSQLEILKQMTNITNQHKNSQKFQYNSQFYVPLVQSTNYLQEEYNKNINRYKVVEQQGQQQIRLQQLPCPVDQNNPLFTNPDFLAKIKEDIKCFGFSRKPSYASTQISKHNPITPNNEYGIQLKNTFKHKKRQNQQQIHYQRIKNLN